MTDLTVPEGWTLSDDHRALERKLQFADFRAAFAFMTEVALLAEKQDHHPDWSNSYSRVSMRITSHDAGTLTQRDVTLAEAVNKVLQRF